MKTNQTITGQTLHVLLVQSGPIRIPDEFSKKGTGRESPMTRHSSPLPDLLKSAKPTGTEHESPLVMGIGRARAMEEVKRILKLEQVHISENKAPALSPDGLHLRISSQGLLGLAVLLQHDAERAGRVGPALAALIITPGAAGPWTQAQDWAFALLMLHAARTGVNGWMGDLAMGTEGTRWLRQHGCPIKPPELSSAIYELQLDVYKRLHGQAAEQQA